jgi:hypothetical protein
VDQINDDEAYVNITWAGQNGDLTSPVPYDTPDAEIRSLAAASLAEGAVAGMDPATADFSGFVVDRFGPSDAYPYNRIMIRPKTPFGIRVG